MKKTLLLTSLLCVLLIASAAQARHRDGDLERIRIHGYIESIRGQIAYVEDDCGELYRVHLGPAWYWEDNGYRLRSGTYVTIIAWMDPYDDYCYAGEIRGHTFTYDLCDSYGFPRWSDREYCDSYWRPTRSFFNIHFVIGGSFWHCHRPHYYRYRPWYAGCYDRPDWHHHWRPGHHGRDHDHGRHRDRDERGGRRGRDGGGGYNYGNDDRNVPPAGGGFNVQVEKPRYVEKQPVERGGEKLTNVRTEIRSTEKVRVSSPTRSNKSSGKASVMTSKRSRSSEKNIEKTYSRK